MKIIEQDVCVDIDISSDQETIDIRQDWESVTLDKQGAKQLIGILQEWVYDE